MSTVPTRRQALLGTAAFSLSLGGVLMPASAFACHRYQSPDGTTGCAAFRRDQASGDSGSSDTVSEPQSPPSTDTGTNTDTQSGSGDPQVSGQTIRVSNGSQLEKALGSARSGNRIELADGSYSGNFVITASGTSNAPILIQGSNRLKAVLQAKLVLRGNHVIVSGLSFDGTGVELRAANLRVTRCYFNGSGTAISVRGADNAEIDYNEIARYRSHGIDFDPLYERRTGLRPHIYRNYCHSGPDSNKNPAINLGQQTGHHHIRVNGIIEYNLCENVSKRYKTIFCKSSQNIVRYNTIINAQGIENRHGFNNKYIGNWLEDCQAFVVSDEDCHVEGNKLVRVLHGIRVMAGTISSQQVPGQGGGVPFADRCQLIDNDVDARLQIGSTYSTWDKSKVLPARDTVVSGHKGRVALQTERNTRITSNSQANAGLAAVRLRPNQVGPNNA